MAGSVHITIYGPTNSIIPKTIKITENQLMNYKKHNSHQISKPLAKHL